MKDQKNRAERIHIEFVSKHNINGKYTPQETEKLLDKVKELLDGSSTMSFTDAECRAAFIAEMNAKAAEIGMADTVFYDPTGRTNITTAHDMCRCLVHATGYDNLQDIWSVPTKEIAFIKADDNVRKATLTHRLIDSDFKGSYNVMGGKSGSLNGGKTMPDGGVLPNGTTVGNMSCVLQSKVNPDDFYAITSMGLYEKNTAYDTKIAAIKAVMDIIENGGDAGVDNSALNEIVYEGKTYRDIFIKNNLAPNINGNTLTRSVNGKTSYTVNSGSPIIEYSKDLESNYVPPYAMKISAGGSCQVKTDNNNSTIIGIKGHTYMAAVNVKVTTHTAGKIGIAVGANTDYKGIEGVTNGYVRYAGKLEPTASSSGNVLFFLGSFSSADITGYINNPVLVDAEIFNTIPSDDKWLAMYNSFNSILQDIYEQNGAVDINTPEVNADYVCAFKLPKYNTRSFRNIKLEPVYEKEMNKSFYPASMTKIMTAMVTLDHVHDLDEKVTMKQEDLDALPTLGWYADDVLVGETMTIKDVLYIMMMASSNISTEILCRVVGSKILKSRNL